LDTSIFDGAQKRIIEPLKRVGIGVKDIAGETQTPYSTACEILTKPGLAIGQGMSYGFSIVHIFLQEYVI
jgi:hypothetical protein